MLKRLFQQKNLISKLLFGFYILVNLAPSIYFFFTQPTNFWGRLVTLLFPLGLYLFVFSLVKNTGKCLVILFPLLFLHSFQIVLFYLFGESVIASDMFLNVVTTNATEAGELLGSLMPAIITVCLLYVPALIFAILQWRKKIFLGKLFRKRTLKIGIASLILAIIISFFSTNDNKANFTFKTNVYPVNIFYNLGYAIHKVRKTNNYAETSANFSYEATRNSDDKAQQVVVLVIGETGRADNWEMYGYSRKTNPRLKQENNLVLFSDALTQANVTYKSVSVILSSVGAKNYKEIYNRKSIFDAFKEVGFTTVCLSNQAENHSMIEEFTKSADIYKTIRTTDKSGSTTNYNDGKLINLMKKVIDSHSENLFIVLHTYGSHYNYNERYPKKFSRFKPDSVTAVSKSQKERLVNAYDNTILYTDYFLAKTIDALKNSSASSLLMYTSDHGEDLFDDDRGKFLHSSPIPTYYQLRIPFFMWFSKPYITRHPDLYKIAIDNENKPVSTNAVFHTLLDASQIKSPYLNFNLSLVSQKFKIQPRLYLNDHDKAVPYLKMNLKPEDFEMIKKHQIQD